MSPTLGRASLTCLVTARSAYCGVSVAESVLFEGSGSCSRPEIVAVLVVVGGMPAGDGGSTVTVITSDTPVEPPRFPIVQRPVAGS